jgi:iron complex outermembrane receptor protein
MDRGRTTAPAAAGARRSRAIGRGAPGRLGALALTTLLAGPAAAVLADAAAAQSGTQQRAAAETYRFDIAAQPLADALNAFSAVTGWEVGYAADTGRGVTTAAVEGSYTPADALQRLLAGTGLVWDKTGAQAVTLRSGGTAMQLDGQSLDPVVVSATRTETPVSQLTRPVTVVDAEDIGTQKRLDRSLGDILSKEVPGFSPSTEALTDFGQTLRGRTFLTMIDGVPQTTPLRDGRRSLNTIDADAIERVEVVRGGTAAYGFGATGGLVNVITRRPEDGAVNAHSEAGLKFSTLHPEDSVEWHANQRVSGRTGQLDYVLSGTFVQRNSFFDAEGDRIPADPFGVQGGLADTDEANLLGKLGYEFGGGEQRLELTANHFNLLQDTEWGGLGTGNPATGQKTPAVRGNINAENPGTINTTLSLNYSHEDLFGSEVKSKVYYNDLTTRFSKFPGFPQVEIVSEKAGARLTVDTPVELQTLPFNLIWGADYLHDTTVQNGIDAPSNTPDMEQDAIAGFLEAEVPIADWGLVRAGVRHEAISVDVDDVVNRRGLFVNGGTLTFNETLFNASGVVYVTDHVDLFGGFSQGFSLADIGRAISDGTATQAEALESEAQKVDNYELGIRSSHDSWDASLTGFLSESENGTTFDSGLSIVKQPERIYGVELSAKAQPHELMRLGGTVSWMEGVVDLDNDGDFEEDLPSTRIPPAKVTGYVEYTPTDWWTARFQGFYSGSRSPDSTLFGGAEVEDYVTFDLYSSFDTGYGTLQIGIDNLFNQDYFPVLNQAAAQSFAYSKAPGQTISLSYSVKW